VSGSRRQAGAATRAEAADATSPALSLVVPVFDEAGNVAPLMDEIAAALAEHGPFEVIAVDDGSGDATGAELDAARRRHRWLRVLHHERRRGKSAALVTGAEAARAPLVATLDGDGQNDPRDVVRLLTAYREAAASERVGLVAGARRRRHDSVLRRLSSRIANGVRRRALRDDSPDTACGLKLLPRAVFLTLPRFEGMHRFIPALVRAQGLQALTIEVDHRPRRAGRPKYGVHNRLWVGLLDMLMVYWLVRRTRPPGSVTED
jgi:dolichol-phosphate mannosyltransferase